MQKTTYYLTMFLMAVDIRWTWTRWIRVGVDGVAGRKVSLRPGIHHRHKWLPSKRRKVSNGRPQVAAQIHAYVRGSIYHLLRITSNFAFWKQESSDHGPLDQTRTTKTYLHVFGRDRSNTWCVGISNLFQFRQSQAVYR